MQQIILFLRIECCFRKFWWNQELNELKEKNIIAYNAWLSAGKPNFGLIYDKKKLNVKRPIETVLGKVKKKKIIVLSKA